jgi:hypothetical protein
MGSTENSHLVPLELSDELKKEEIITRFEKDNRTNCLKLSLNHKYKKKCFIFQIPTKRIDWNAIITMIAKALKAFGMSPGHMLMIEDVMQTNYEVVIGLAETADQQNPGNGKQKEMCYVRKYTANGLLPLHESVVFTDSGQSAFVYLDNDGKLGIVNHIERPDKILYPADNVDSQNPLPYAFNSSEELQKYIELASRENLASLYQAIKINFRRYINVDEHYEIMLSSDVILSYFQEKFPTMHLDIFVGDNGSGKNSAQSVISRLGYRVYSLVSASAPNYFTAYGNVEEAQVTIAEDEVGDLDKDYQKQKILKSGYASGGTVPKTDFPNGKRSQVLYNVYGIKWLAMEELPDSKIIKGILDRSFIYYFIVGHVDYNIKDVIKNAGDPKYKPLNDELVHLHKLLFAFKLIHFNDVIPDLEINLENRNAELTKPSLRLFSSLGAPKAIEEIRLALSKFVQDKNELKSNSIESKLCTAVNELVKARDENPTSEEYDGLENYAFTNDQIWNKCRLVMDGIDIWGKSESFYSTEYGKITHKKISGLIQSKFKAKPFKTDGDNSRRGWRFQKEILDRITSHYVTNQKEIMIHTKNARHETKKVASVASDASHYNSPQLNFNENLVSGQSQNAVSHESETDANRLDNDRNLDHDDIDISNINNNINDNKNKNDKVTVPANKINNNYNITETNSNNDSCTNAADSALLSKIARPASPDLQSIKVELYSNMSYGLPKCDASDASDATGTTSKRIKTKAEQTRKPDLPCIHCDFKDPIEFDLSLHYLEKHRENLIRLPIGKSSMDDRADYAVELSKKKFLESFKDDDESNDDNDEEEKRSK